MLLELLKLIDVLKLTVLSNGYLDEFRFEHRIKIYCQLKKII